MSYGIQVETWGRYALFSRPELKTERMSYEVITPSAARGLIESIFWHPGLRIVIDRIHVLNEIRFTRMDGFAAAAMALFLAVIIAFRWL